LGAEVFRPNSLRNHGKTHQNRILGLDRSGRWCRHHPLSLCDKQSYGQPYRQRRGPWTSSRLLTKLLSFLFLEHRRQPLDILSWRRITRGYS
jgi:hypothetical protein